MARVQYGGGITQFRGSIAGNTFQRSSAGEIARHRAFIARRTTTMQSETHAATFDLQQVWRTLAEDAPAMWNDYAVLHGRTTKFGQQVLLNGFSFFISINSNRRLLGEPDHEYPPTWALPNPLTSCYTYSGSPFGQLLFYFDPTPSDEIIILYTCPPLPTYTQSFRSKLRFTKIIPIGTNSGIHIEDDWEATHGLTFPPSDPANFQDCCMAYTVKASSGLISPGVYGSTPEEQHT